jgi:phage shock protein PspC (stress-responsive transcriptional regulator)
MLQVRKFMIRRSSKYAMIGGVCAGYAISENKPVALVRTFAVLVLVMTGGTAALVYLAAWAIMPGASAGGDGSWEHLNFEHQLVRRPDNKVLGGVCGAIAEYFKVDATMVRALTLVLFLIGGVGIIAYFVAWAIIPEKT